MKRKTVWKIWITLALIALLSITALAGCSSESSTSNKGDGAKSTETSAGTNTLEKIKKRGKLIVGVKYDLNLFGLKNPETGKVEGFDIDIAKGLAKKILGDENKIELKEVTSKTRIPMLNNGEIDAIIATMTITEERKKEVDFSDVYFMAGQSLLVKKDSKINSVKDLKKG